MSEKLLLVFKKEDSPCGLSRASVKALALREGLTETALIHRALAQYQMRQGAQAIRPKEPLTPTGIPLTNERDEFAHRIGISPLAELLGL